MVIPLARINRESRQTNIISLSKYFGVLTSDDGVAGNEKCNSGSFFTIVAGWFLAAVTAMTVFANLLRKKLEFKFWTT